MNVSLVAAMMAVLIGIAVVVPLVAELRRPAEQRSRLDSPTTFQSHLGAWLGTPQRRIVVATLFGMAMGYLIAWQQFT